MGKLVPFRRRRRWTRPGHYGHADQRRAVTAKGLLGDTLRWLGLLRPFILFGILASLWVGYDPALVEPPGVLSTNPETVDERFTRCGPGRGHACVIDGDTFKLGDRKIRIVGIDAPEVDGRCPEETAKAKAATAELRRLLNQGPFEMTAPVYGRKDRYGRDLRALRRTLPDGTRQSIAAEMRESGLARRYLSGLRGGWC